MSKKSEIILVTENNPSIHFGASDYIHFYEDDNEAWKDEVITGASFIDRWLAEVDKTIVQFIPYIICINPEGRILSYKRKGGGEGRLEGKFSIGIGGHVNTDDVQEFRQIKDKEGALVTIPVASWNVITRGAIREIEEELHIDKGYAKDNLIELGIIYTPTDEGNDKVTAMPAVGEVHLGIIYGLLVHNKITTQVSEGLIRPRFIDEDMTSRHKYEYWSKLILENMSEAKRIFKEKSI